MVAAFAASSMVFSLVYRFEYRVPINPNDPRDPSVIEHLSQYLGVLAAVIFGTAVACAFFVRKIGPISESSDARPLLEDTCADTPPLRLFVSLNFWLSFSCIFLIAGPGLMWLTVQGSIAVSREWRCRASVLFSPSFCFFSLLSAVDGRQFGAGAGSRLDSGPPRDRLCLGRNRDAHLARPLFHSRRWDPHSFSVLSYCFGQS